MKIAVAGMGYVGLSIATLLAQHNEVIAYNIIEEKIKKINEKITKKKDKKKQKKLRTRKQK